MAPRIGPEPESPELSAVEKLLHALPFGIGIRGKPRDYLAGWKALWDNRSDLLYARRLLKHGVCDGCSLGPAGLRDDVADGRHLCRLRLRELRTHTMDGLETGLLGDLRPLREADAAELRGLGRLPEPLVRHRGENGFTPLPWEEALDLAAERLKGLDPRRTAWFAGARTITNEGAFALRSVAQVTGSPNLDSSARFGYESALGGLGDVFGVRAPTSSLRDLLGTDLLVLWGTDPSVTHPVLLKYLHLAREQGTRVAVVNPRREPGLVKSWIPSILDSSVFGSRLLDDAYPVRKGGDIAFMNGVMKFLDERGGLAGDFLSQHAAGLEELQRKVRSLPWDELVRGSGVPQEAIERFAGIYSAANSAVFVFGAGLLRAGTAAANARSLATLTALRGMVGKKRCGVLPLGGGGEQGSVDLGIRPGAQGLTAPEQIKAAQEGRIDALCSVSGDLLEAPVSRAVVERALERIGLRIHVGPVLDPSMLVPPGDLVLVLPSQTRYECRGGSTSTSVERRVRLSPEIPGSRIAGAKPEWQIPVLIAQRMDLANEGRLPWKDASDVRREIERSVPIYKGLSGLKEEGQWIQWGGERLFERGDFSALPGGRCRLQAQDLPALAEEPPADEGGSGSGPAKTGGGGRRARSGVC